MSEIRMAAALPQAQTVRAGQQAPAQMQAKVQANAQGQPSAVPALPAEEEKVSAFAQPEDGYKSLSEMMLEAKQKAEEQRERFKLPNSTRYGDGPMEAYARLGRARTAAQVSAASGFARRRIMQYQSALRSDPDNAARIRAAIASLKKAVGRANKKKRELQQEQITEGQRIKALQRKEEQKAMRLKRELCHRKTMRSIREQGYLRETEIENRLQDQLQQTRMELQMQMQQLSGPTISPEAAAQQYAAASASGTAGGAEAAMPAASVDVQV